MPAEDTDVARKTADEAELTRQSLLSAGVEVFAEHGVPKTSLEMIAQRANLSRGSVYWHFKGKDALLNEILEGCQLPFENFFCPGSSMSINLRHLRLAILETFTDARYRQLCQILMLDAAGLDKATSIALRFERLKIRLSLQLKALLDGAVEKGEVNTALSISATSQLLKICLLGLIFDCTHEPEEVHRRVTGTLDALEAILKEPPDALIGVRPGLAHC
jgi:AcrR family transcriptional regulator